MKKKKDDYAHDTIHPTFNSKDQTVCQTCKKVGPVYQNSVNEKWVCFKCLPAKDIDRYPGWRERMKKSREKNEKN